MITVFTRSVTAVRRGLIRSLRAAALSCWARSATRSARLPRSITELTLSTVAWLSPASSDCRSWKQEYHQTDPFICRPKRYVCFSGQISQLHYKVYLMGQDGDSGAEDASRQLGELSLSCTAQQGAQHCTRSQHGHGAVELAGECTVRVTGQCCVPVAAAW